MAGSGSGVMATALSITGTVLGIAMQMAALGSQIFFAMVNMAGIAFSGIKLWIKMQLAALAAAMGLVRRVRTRSRRRHRLSDLGIKLTYFDFKSRGEPIRLALLLGKVEFEDERIPGTPEGYSEVRRRREARCIGPGGQVPVLEVKGVQYSQSQAILRFVGREVGLYPEGMDQLVVDQVEETLDEIRDLTLPAWYGAALPRSRNTGEPGVPLSEQQRAEVSSALNTDYLPSKFRIVEGLLAGSPPGPWFLGERLSICDISSYVLVEEIETESGGPGISPSVLDDCPLLRAHAERFASLPEVAAHNAKHAMQQAS